MGEIAHLTNEGMDSNQLNYYPPPPLHCKQTAGRSVQIIKSKHIFQRALKNCQRDKIGQHHSKALPRIKHLEIDCVLYVTPPPHRPEF